ncbi:hypothetical protein BpHYR1_025362 [Brachionus plicatilis]|uniref:Uncharacterized protein n=1 Tax=Brachionus plicatilis TaxID=10195 RepID=A0A3M7RSK7_BRAPC|nr:hypothetical protein BpHYR1_025362 [Brachionus plicatilis]
MSSSVSFLENQLNDTAEDAEALPKNKRIILIKLVSNKKKLLSYNKKSGDKWRSHVFKLSSGCFKKNIK